MKLLSPFRSLPVLLAILVLTDCRDPATGGPEVYRKLSGETMGTTYHVTYLDSLHRVLQPGIDSLLVALNLEVSTYIDSSLISRFNRSETGLELSGTEVHFLRNLHRSRDVWSWTDGAFDPTVMPLVNYWGFGYTGRDTDPAVDSQEVARRLQWVGLDRITGADTLGPGRLAKADPAMQLDFSALAKGYGVDLVGQYLREAGIHDFLVEIGGEILAAGISPRGGPWGIGVNLPEERAGLDDMYSRLEVTGRAVATSGNYRNVHVIDNVTYSHTLNPKTGYPERRNLLSATVVTADCMTADALATACMVLGVDGAKDLATRLPGVDLYLIFSTPDGRLADWASPGMSAWSVSR